jgi:aryl-alcohol dehydrogenase-like predicted oxidoreductase
MGDRAIKGHRDEYVIATKFARRIEPTTVAGDLSTLGPLDGSAELPPVSGARYDEAGMASANL